MSAVLTICESSSRRRRGEQMPKHKGDRIEERLYKSLWHLFAVAAGVYELRHHKSKFSKVLACGIIAFHVDAAVSDALDTPPLSRVILDWVRPDDGESEDSNR